MLYLDNRTHIQRLKDPEDEIPHCSWERSCWIKTISRTKFLLISIHFLLPIALEPFKRPHPEPQESPSFSIRTLHTCSDHSPPSRSPRMRTIERILQYSHPRLIAKNPAPGKVINKARVNRNQNAVDEREVARELMVTATDTKIEGRA